jgi:hypothetical protein
MISDYDKALKAVLKDIESLYAKTLAGVKPEDYYNTVIKFDRLAKMQTEIEKKLAYYTKLADQKMIEASKVAMNNNYYRQLYGLEFVAPYPTAIGFSLLDDKIVESSVFGTPEKWKAIQTAALEKYGESKAYQPKYGTLTDLLLKKNYDAANKIRQAVSSGLVRGASFTEISKEIANIIGTANNTGATGLAGNSLRIAQTESIRLLNAGAYAEAGIAEDAGLEVKREWVATLDSRTRQSHADLDGTRVSVGEPFVIDGDTGYFPGDFSEPENSINCFLGDTVLIPSNLEKIYKRFYSGKVVKIKTLNGKSFIVTPNHPILTDRGWVPAGDINSCDYLISCKIKGFFIFKKLFKAVKIDNIYSAACKLDNLSPIIIPILGRNGSEKDFHGDGTSHDINIKDVNGFLECAVESSRGESSGYLELAVPGTGKGSLKSERPYAKIGICPFNTANSIMGIFRKFKLFILGKMLHSFEHTLASVSNLYPFPAERPIYCGSRYADPIRNRLQRLPAFVRRNKVIDVVEYDFSGHVYNLQTKEGCYGVYQDNGIMSIAKNCRCTVIDVIDGISPDLRRARDPVSGEYEIISYKNYDDWIKEKGLKYSASGRLVPV